jgi:hypothetical protein
MKTHAVNNPTNETNKKQPYTSNTAAADKSEVQSAIRRLAEWGERQ